MNRSHQTGRYRSGQTGQTVNLLALRLRWFESSPAHICPMSVVCAVLSAENQIGSKRKSTDTADSTAPVCRQHRYLIASSLATITPAAVSAAAVTYTATAATRPPRH